LSPDAGQNLDIKIAKRCFGNVAKFRYLGKTVTNQNLIQEEIKKFEYGLCLLPICPGAGIAQSV
jgi:ribosomal protein S2